MPSNKVFGPNIRDIQTIIQAGINPKNGLPIKMGTDPADLKPNVKKILRIIDEQDAVNRYVWYNLPMNLSSQEIERLLYYKGQLAFFYEKNLEQFYIMPYALDGAIDFYGRFKTIHPIPIYAGGKDKEENDALEKYLSDIKLNVKYGVMDNEASVDDLENSCVLLHDYTKQLSETILPRQGLNDPILDTMAECIPYMRTSMLLSTGVKGIRVNDADQQLSVLDGLKSYYDAVMKGDAWVPLVGTLEFQELTDGATSKSEEYMLAMQSLDNFRLSTYGIDNGGLFEKKAHELQSEADLNGGPVGLVLQDGLSIRQNFCNIVNSIWGLGIWCEPAQNVSGADITGDGLMYDDNSMSQSSGMEESEDDAGI